MGITTIGQMPKINYRLWFGLSKNLLKIKIPIKVISEANATGEHWTKKHKRHKIQKLFITAYLGGRIDWTWLPCQITLTRIAPRKLDYDNLCCSFKFVTDTICDLLVPGLKAGRADGDERIKKIEYLQRKGEAKEYAIEIEICRI